MGNIDLFNEINTILKNKGISASRASVESGLSVDFIRNLKRKPFRPKLDNLQKLANYLGVNVNIFLQTLDEKISPLNVSALVSKIDEILQIKGISERKACIDAGISTDFIRDMRRKGNAPKTDKILKLAQSLNVDVNVFLHALNEKIPLNTFAEPNLPFTTINIVGQVEAGRWAENLQWPREDWLPFLFPNDTPYKDHPLFALKVKGDSMNLVYPDGSIVIAVNFCDLGRTPENGDCVLTVRRDPLTDCYESTLKIVQIRDDGSVLLWPRSNNPDFTRPIQLPELTTNYQGGKVNGDTSPPPDIHIQSLIIWSLSSVQKILI
ncbi:S24 family peptidase [Commensalibacter oyaizuii]|uniref:S24 family peptidase n=1 Tax=Commensalibacter oyaizuii TaxID=3043873 RepID=A0ABT6Q398_9PROT|nr:S24 family peptidase [Commensalibacter sp. TBRC 16381]MDI2091595.1 S24 family peptidase [Commensalibacter sp. TBRC 16381]